MLNILQGFSSKADTDKAVDEICQQITQNNLKYVMFFAGNNYDFERIAKRLNDEFPNINVVGCTTAGEISKNNLTVNTLAAISIASNDFKVESLILEEISKYPVLYHDRILEALKKLDVNPEKTSSTKNLFAITLMDGLSGGEEKALSVINSVFDGSTIPLVGASAGDGLDFRATKIALNGKIYLDAALVSFIKTEHQFYIYKENIFRPMGKQLVVTKADASKRLVYEFDNKPAALCYAEKLGIKVEKLNEYFMINPLGRRLEDKIWIISPFKINEDYSIQFYCRVLANSVLEVLEPDNPVEEIKKTIKSIESNISNVKGLIVFNCILRRLQFDKENIGDKIIGPLSKMGAIAGFSSYGEQMNNTHLNQTMVILALGE